ncbi:MAG: helix-turn-helix domain-containing protein [Thaumarchaeota archaeon]|nr:helix-turn-helix domain-containing protein [Nitrososphaerota archaeon]
MATRKPHRAAYVVRDERIAMLLVDPMRRTMLNLLADEPFTESQLSELLGLTNASIGHHLRILLRAKLIEIEKREEEAHGIMQNFYRSIALCIVVDTGQMPKSVVKYFFPINIERIRGALAAMRKQRRTLTLNTKRLDAIAENLSVQIAREAAKLGERKVTSDRETTAIEIYRRALDKSICIKEM